jgi:hypothetical protein
MSLLANGSPTKTSGKTQQRSNIMSTVYATPMQILALLARQNLVFTADQISTNTFIVNGQTLKIRQGVVDELRNDLNSSVFTTIGRNRILLALESLRLSSRGRPANSRSSLLKHGYRCYTVSDNGRISVPAGAFFNLDSSEKVTAHFIDNGKESYIKVMKHK